MSRQEHGVAAHRLMCMPVVVVCALAAAIGCERRSPSPVTSRPPRQSSGGSSSNEPSPSPQAMADLMSELGAGTKVEFKPGIAAVILVDTSGSMGQSVRGGAGKMQPKIEIAREAARNIVRQTQAFAKEQPGEPTLIGLYEFSARSRGAACRPVLALAAPDPAAADQAVGRMTPEGDTPIGEAIVQAKRDLDNAGLARRHILVITDGENTRGVAPGAVLKAINGLPEEQRPGIYFVAFDVDAKVFADAKEAGALVLPAANGKELQERLDFIMGNKILLEK